MSYVIFTVVAVGLYIMSDWILNRMEERRGARYKYRTLIFFGLILVSALVVFQIINLLTG